MSALTFAAHTSAISAGHLLRVVNYHNTPASGAEMLRRELAQYAERHRSVTLEDVDTFFETGQWSWDQPPFMPVFYEGYRNSYDVAGAVCDELGITGWFAICTGFVECEESEQEVFARSHFIGLVEEELALGRIAMSWEEVADLSQRHVVFPHTASHDGIADVISDEDVEREITRPKVAMDQVTGQSAAVFAWLHGSPFGTSPRHDGAVVAAGYRYLISNTTVHRIA